MALLVLLLLSISINLISMSSSKPQMKSYIIHIDKFTKPYHFSTPIHWYYSIINSSVSSTNFPTLDRIFYTYDTAMNGFAAKLTQEEAKLVSKTQGVIKVYDDSVLQLQTTRSPDFLGLTMNHDSLVLETNFGKVEDVIVGMVDSGLWPESPSFDDTGYPPVSIGWRGKCMFGEVFNITMCNRKIVGAKYFNSGVIAQGGKFGEGAEYLSPRDKNGHGTHTSSTAVGSLVENANHFGFAEGTARGTASRARVAMYKACWNNFGCVASDVLAAMEAATKDGVHILSISLGGPRVEFYDDVIAIGAFGAVRNGVFVACAAGNSGPSDLSVTNTAPWIMTVGAGSVDRAFPAHVVLGNGKVCIGESIYVELSIVRGMNPIVYLGQCFGLNMTSRIVKRRIVVCNDTFGMVGVGMLIAEGGGIGLITLNGPERGEGIMLQSFTLPTVTLGYKEAQKLLSYIHSTTKPRATLKFLNKTIIGEKRAPSVAPFSSRGPSRILYEILKPDIIAPGMNIIAAWPTEMPVTRIRNDKRRSSFNIMSGTSMSCPHVAGIAALLRASHPKWTPAMIRSAMITTAFVLDNGYRPIILDENMESATPFAFGAGHVDPIRAKDPGLVYDASEQNYIDLLCSMNYTKKQIRVLVPKPFSCIKLKHGVADLNYPSFVVVFHVDTKVQTLKRTLTKVSELPEVYKARTINPRPDKVKINIEPNKLKFGAINEKLSYKVHFKKIEANGANKPEKETVDFGYVIWENYEHQVKSPVVLVWKIK